MASQTSLGNADAVGVEEMMKILECSICHEIPLTSIKICQTGHSVCANCRTRPGVSRCGLCRKEFLIRNFRLESVVQATAFKCKYHGQGCTEICKGSEMELHQLNCYHRPVSCNIIGGTFCADNSVNIEGFIQHLKMRHDCEEIVGEIGGLYEVALGSTSSTFHINGERLNAYMRLDGKYFLQYFKTDDTNVYFWNSLMGKKEEAANYIAVITVLSFNHRTFQTNPVSVKYTIPVSTVHDTFQSVLEKGKVAGLPKSCLKTFCLDDVRNFWGIEVSILKK